MLAHLLECCGRLHQLAVLELPLPLYTQQQNHG